MPTVADLLNCPHEIEHDGVVYKLRQPDQLEQGKLARHLEDRAWATYERRASGLDDAAAERLERATARDVTSGVYEYGSEACAEFLQTPAGVAKLIHVILQRDHPDVTEDVARGLLEHHLKRTLAAITAGATGDPKAVAAVLGMLGLPRDFLRPSDTSSSKSRTRRSTKRRTKSGR